LISRTVNYVYIVYFYTIYTSFSFINEFYPFFMNIEQQHYRNDWHILPQKGNFKRSNASLVLAFGSISQIEQSSHFDYLRNTYVNANIVMASDCGQIVNETVHNDTIISNAFHFEQSTVKTSSFNIKNFDTSHILGQTIANSFETQDLKLVLIIADGILVNGSDLVKGIREYIGDNVIVTGGLAGDDAKFVATKVGLNGIPVCGEVVAVGFYGQHLNVGFGSFGGFDAFGPERLITKSKKNVLYEIDHKNALDLYKEYLGKYAAELPSSALAFPLGIMTDGEPLVRTVLGVNEAEKSITFAGNINEGDIVRMMKANFTKLFDAATTSATNALTPFVNHAPEFALLISCVGRKSILRERIDEEIEKTRNILGDKTIMSGFYSYGEISPFSKSVKCELFNQTMTITTFSEHV
jgi:hypothetical protein